MSIPPRPDVTEEMVAELADKIYPGLGQVIARNYRRYMDGFELCKELERYECWDTTRDDMDKLEELDCQVSRLHDRLEKEWAAEHSPQPRFGIGDRIKSPNGRSGVITGFSEYSPAYYMVKKDGAEDKPSLIERLLVKFEDAVAD